MAMSPPSLPLARIPPELVSVADYEDLARRGLAPAVSAWLFGGAADEITLRDNRAGFDRVRLRGRVMQNLAGGGTGLTLFGQTLDYPILLAPVAHQRLVHAEAECATALGAAAVGAAQVVSMLASMTLEEIAGVSRGVLWFQLYLQPRRSQTLELLRRAEAAGYRAIVLTVDATVSGVRNREQRAGFSLPPGIDAANLRGMPPVSPHLAGPGRSAVFGTPLLDHAPTWDDLDWLLSMTRLPVLIKGVAHPADALRAVEAGAAGLIVSNHGGRTLDTMAASIDVLPEVVDAVSARVPVLLDGGVRRGTDVLKAIALGASAVLVGRPYMAGLAVGGASGVAHVLHILRAEFEAAMVLCGCRVLGDIDRGLIAGG